MTTPQTCIGKSSVAKQLANILEEFVLFNREDQRDILALMQAIGMSNEANLIAKEIRYGIGL